MTGEQRARQLAQVWQNVGTVAARVLASGSRFSERADDGLRWVSRVSREVAANLTAAGSFEWTPEDGGELFEGLQNVHIVAGFVLADDESRLSARARRDVTWIRDGTRQLIDSFAPHVEIREG